MDLAVVAQVGAVQRIAEASLSHLREVEPEEKTQRELPEQQTQVVAVGVAELGAVALTTLVEPVVRATHELRIGVNNGKTLHIY